MAFEKFEQSIVNKTNAIQSLRDEILSKKWKTEKQKIKMEERLERLESQLRLHKETRDYNLGTSLRNYIDPRVFKAWMSYMNLDWARIYTATLQRKFLWVDNISKKELSSFLPK